MSGGSQAGVAGLYPLDTQRCYYFFGFPISQVCQTAWNVLHAIPNHLCKQVSPVCGPADGICAACFNPLQEQAGLCKLMRGETWQTTGASCQELCLIGKTLRRLKESIISS